MKNNKLPEQSNLLRKPKKLWWRRLLWLFSGVILGVGLVAGGALITGTLVQTKDLIALTGADPNEYLTEEYQKKTITQLIMSLANGSTSFNSLDDISNITPFVDTILNQANDALDEQFGFTFDRDELFALSWDQIPNYALDTVYEGIKLAKVLNITESTTVPALKYLAFNKNGDGTYNYESMRSIKDLQNDMETIINNATIGDLIDVGDSGVVYNLRNLHIGTMASEINELKVNQLIDTTGGPKAMQWVGEQKINEVATAFQTATVGDLFEIEAGNTFMEAIQDCAVATLASDIMNKTLGELTGNQENPEPPIKALKDFTVGDLVNGTFDLNTVALGDIVDIDPNNTILYALRDCTVGNIDDTAKNTVIGELFSEEELQNNRILYALRNYTLATMQQGIGKCVLTDFVEFDIDSPSTPKFLKYLIVNEVAIEDIDTAMNNMTISDMVDVGSSGILYELRNSTLSSLATDVQNLTLGSIIEITSTSPKILRNLADKTLSQIPGELDTLTIAKVLEDDVINASNLLVVLKDEPLSTLGTRANNLTIKELLNITEYNEQEFPKIIIALKDYKITEIGEHINDIQLQQMTDIDEYSPRILQALKTATINNLSTKIEGLTFADFFDPTSEEVTQNRFLRNIPGDTPLTSLGSAISSLKFVDTFGDLIFEDPSDTSTIKGTWKLLMCVKSGTDWDFVGADYTISVGLENMMSNMRSNMTIATLYELRDAGLVEDPDGKLDHVPFGSSKPLGDFTMPEIIDTLTSF